MLASQLLVHSHKVNPYPHNSHNVVCLHYGVQTKQDEWCDCHAFEKAIDDIAMLYIPRKNNTGYCVLGELKCIVEWLVISATLWFDIIGLFRTLPNIYDGDFLAKIVNSFPPFPSQ